MGGKQEMPSQVAKRRGAEEGGVERGRGGAEGGAPTEGLRKSPARTKASGGGCRLCLSVSSLMDEQGKEEGALEGKEVG